MFVNYIIISTNSCLSARESFLGTFHNFYKFEPFNLCGYFLCQNKYQRSTYTQRQPVHCNSCSRFCA